MIRTIRKEAEESTEDKEKVMYTIFHPRINLQGEKREGLQVLVKESLAPGE